MTIGVPEYEFDLRTPEFDGDKRLVKLALFHHFPMYERPREFLWEKFCYPHTLADLLLWRDGRWAYTYDPYDNQGADSRIPQSWVGPYDDWRARVLRQAGFSMVLCDPKGMT